MKAFLSAAVSLVAATKGSSTAATMKMAGRRSRERSQPRSLCTMTGGGSFARSVGRLGGMCKRVKEEGRAYGK